MPPSENHHVKTEREWLQQRLVEGLNAGIEMQARDYPDYVREMYAKRGPYERGVLAACVLEELGLLVNEEEKHSE